ncbi:hypothetical protein LTR35_006225 [Friedmanniomyces endolithicus]|uniref:Uncharacterized protein n=1 Tax=Friedmanniomyces endolithicus TaxID=329885 RepID=A0AAN6JFA8_9PEZI|nr:hypothetical protein LTR35_006225 [Friedmanniomyces endolithicus]KAK0301299.1 hypothetical protein LTS00_000448 [Friedmanniomyces endolithicus]KAK0322215.1 hypothetical protein LTR82_006668 [Friedmanniomyces endolithicus]KAK1014515.1 hypothetical protein LTR54_004167 [Friedmanniomyces endolithicus]KAK1059030.1 hypothetical protein LTR74_012919 [Friedmanniomyces endolithicus]
MGLLTSLREKIDLYRLEQRYTRRDKRTTFTSGASYVDGEYVYNHSSPSSPTASAKSSGSSSSFGSLASRGRAGAAGAGSRLSVLRVAEVFAGGKRGGV